ncbi:MAG: M20/M25/M40 family metallo-hydrolase [Dehalococcoidia bacterium]
MHAPSPVHLLRSLIRFNTTNGINPERPCVEYLGRLLSEAGLATEFLAKDPQRPNLLARLPGRGEAPPLLLYGHVDVVGVEGQRWTHPPFEGSVVDGCVWGRGAVDMKGGLAMMAAALLRVRAEGMTPPGDVIFAAVSDEEAGGEYGSRFLVEKHADRFAGVRYALGEVGGFTLVAMGRRFYPVMVAEKQACWLKVTFRGPAGHGSMPPAGSAMTKMAEAMRHIESVRLPVHVTPTARAQFTAMARALPLPAAAGLRLLLVPWLTDRILGRLGERATVFGPALHNTVTPTMTTAGTAPNVVPAEAILHLDGRILPGFGRDDLVREVRDVIGDEPEIEVLHHDPGPAEPDMGLYDLLAGVITELDPEGVPVPMLLPGTTDARFFSRLGIQTYGFTPMKLPPDLDFSALFHGEDERVPVSALEFGADAVYRVLLRAGDPSRQ